MHKLTYLCRNINLLNTILITGIVLLSVYIVLPMLNVNINYSLTPAKKTPEVKEEGSPQSQLPSASDYIVIAEQNLFHPERKIPPEKKGEGLPKPEFILYGTLITDNLSIAYMEDKNAPYSTPGRGNRQKAVRLGSILSGYTLSEVYHDKIVMVKNGDKIEVAVLDSAHPKTRSAETATAAKTVQPGKPAEQKVSPLQKQPSSAQVTGKTERESQKDLKKSLKRSRRDVPEVNQ